MTSISSAAHMRSHVRLSLTFLDELEAEAVEIIREVAAEGERPVMMYSIGKDSSVMLHLARKAFFPAPVPFPLLHVDTTLKFPEMIEFRDRMARELAFDLRVHTNHQAVDDGDLLVHPPHRQAQFCKYRSKS